MQLSKLTLRFLFCLAVVPWGPGIAVGETAEFTYTAPDQALAAGEQLESRGEWLPALELYEAATERWAGDEDLKYALRRTKINFGIDRRYTDQSFRTALLARGRTSALELFDDILSRVQFEYVDDISASRFVAHGTESLYMALRNPRFMEQQLGSADPEEVEEFRKMLIREYWNRPVRSRREARSLVSGVCDRARARLGLGDADVIMEYVFGGCNALDEYSNFLTPDRYDDLFGSIRGELVGIGIEMEAVESRGMHLVNVLLDSPAEEGGLRPGDYIVAVNGTDCRDLNADETARLLRGESGSRVQLQFEDPDGRLKTATLTRRRVRIRSITRAVILDDRNGVAYVRMEGFQNTTVQELDDALNSLDRRGMKALIWDLRGNPGGLLDAAAEVLDRFIDQGTLVSTEGRSADQRQVFSATPFNTRRIPLVLLVDGKSASASEIVAGAIHDHKRGTIVGQKTYGKWSVQSIMNLPGGTGLKLTTARFFSPGHHNYSGEGLSPDVLVPRGTTRTTYFRARTPDELITDPEIAEGLDILTNRVGRR